MKHCPFFDPQNTCHTPSRHIETTQEDPQKAHAGRLLPIYETTAFQPIPFLVFHKTIPTTPFFIKNLVLSQRKIIFAHDISPLIHNSFQQTLRTECF